MWYFHMIIIVDLFSINVSISHTYNSYFSVLLDQQSNYM